MHGRINAAGAGCARAAPGRSFGQHEVDFVWDGAMLKLVTASLGGLHAIHGAAVEFFFGPGPTIPGGSFSQHEAKLCLEYCHAETCDSFSWLCARHPWRGC